MRALTNIVLIGVAEGRRTELFQAALVGLGLPAATVISYTDLVGGRTRLADHVRAGTLLRLDSPGKEFAAERALLCAGADACEEEGTYARIARREAETLEFEKGRILYPRQWFQGFRNFLRLVEEQLSACAGHRLMNSATDVATMFDKPRCHQRLSEVGAPVPESLGEVGSFDELRERMHERGCARVFVKLAHGSSASGVVAYQTDGRRRQRAATTVEVVRSAGELRLYNSRRVRVYQEAGEIAALINALCRHRVHVERWLPKAGVEGKTFDLRVVVIGGEARHAVVRLSRHPMTNLHLLGGRGPLDAVVNRMGEAGWERARRTCERALAAGFPRSLYAGVDLRISPDYSRHDVLEVNAFGDLLPGVLHKGQDTYTAELEAILKQKLNPLRLCAFA
ncbi:MAG TPA: STM4014 family protein [Pyrinomonadaceae bacterium]|nr:STM4014 family protein [Pyrinomonadaceae bacterium]